MSKYFDTRTGALVDDFEAKPQVEHRLAQSYPIVPVTDQVAKIIEAGREKLKIKDNELGPVGGVVEIKRPDAQESGAEAKRNYEREQEELRKAQAVPRSEQPKASGKSSSKAKTNRATTKVRDDGEKESHDTGKKVKASTKKK